MTVQVHDRPAELVEEALRGVVDESRGALTLVRDPLFVARAERAGTDARVALVSGGGSGHEPLHVGFVGEGMLSAAVPGQVFASPTAEQVLAAVTRVDRGAGVLLIVKNYTGDVLNFRLAAEDAIGEGHAVEVVVVADDLASDGDGPGRRGTGAALIVEKLAGAAAAEGRSLQEVAEVARSAAERSRSLAVAFRSATLPGRTDESFLLESGHVEHGVGIHGERGREQPAAASGSAQVAQLAAAIAEGLGLKPGDQVIALVNGLGGTPLIQLAAAREYLRRALEESGIAIARSLTGSYVTALDMQGLSLTLLKAEPGDLELWDAPVRTAALAW